MTDQTLLMIGVVILSIVVIFLIFAVENLMKRVKALEKQPDDRVQPTGEPHE